MSVINNPNQEDRDSISYFFFSLIRKLWDFAVDIFDLKTGMDREGAILEIRNNKRMQGANAWLLMCSIMVASLGLDLNSPAVIIGAMLRQKCDLRDLRTSNHLKFRLGHL